MLGFFRRSLMMSLSLGLAAAAVASENKPVDLEPAGIKATLQAPEGATAAESFGTVEVKAGEGFQLEINSDAADLAARKEEIKGNTLNKLKQFLVDSSDSLLYETEVMGKPEFHLVANVDVGGSGFHCEDTKGPVYTQAQAEAMLASCKSITAK